MTTAQATRVHFEVSNADLMPALRRLSGIVDHAQVIQILSFVKCELRNDCLLVLASNSEIEMHVRLPVSTVEQQQKTFTLPCKKLLDICRTLPGSATLSIEQNGNWTTIKVGKTQFKLAALDAQGFPQLDEFSAEAEFSLSETEFLWLLRRTAFAMAQQDVRFYLNGMLLVLAPQRIETAATDGHRLACNSVHYPEDLPERKCIIPKKTIQELCKHLQDRDSIIRIRLGQQHIAFLGESLELYSNLIEGEYPDYHKLLPSAFNYTATLPLSTLQDSLQRLITLANEKYYGASLDFADSSLTLRANNINHEEAHDELVIDYEGKAITIGLNISYVQELLQVISTELVTIGIVDSEKSISFNEVGSNNQSRFIVMPLTL